ncbi:MAG: 3-dehydro-L-gulonate 2-dehydrogenase [Sphaerochaetaceae bacterium]|nr:3-dehydro-L-gulonate 2-dehydrogenase [Sphaerochaetaceae bacterium]
MADIRITLEELEKTLAEKFEKHGMTREDALKSAGIFTRNAADGVISHSILRVKRMVGHCDCGIIVPTNMPILVSGFSAVERYDANKAPGVLSAGFCMERACELASQYGIGMVALAHANHWMRAGYYGWLAAEKGYVGMCWTNTLPNLPSWGSMESNIGNNPFVMSVPCKDGNHMVLDTSMAQYSYGKLEVTRIAGKTLPTDGGYDENGNITRDPGAIEKTRRPLPMGFWKGSSMSILIDATAALLSDGANTASVGQYMKENGCDETYVSQVFIAIDPRALGESHFQEIEKSIKDSIHNAKPITEGKASRYPGENVLASRARAEKEGIVVSEEVWNSILAL